MKPGLHSNAMIGESLFKEQNYNRVKKMLKSGSVEEKNNFSKLLVRYCAAAPDSTTLLEALKKYIDWGLDINYFNPEGFQKNTILFQVIWNDFKNPHADRVNNAYYGRNKFNIIELLVEKGANINYQNGEGFTALMLCTTRSGVFEYLLKKGADPFLKDNTGRDTLVHAINNEFFSAVRDIVKLDFPPHANAQQYLDLLKEKDLNFYGDSEIINKLHIVLEQQTLSQVLPKNEDIMSGSKKTMKI